MSSAAVITLSDKGSLGLRPDASGPALAEELSARGLSVVSVEVLPDDPVLLADRLRYWADERRVTLVATTGGTGLAPRDRTPEALAEVCGSELPAVGERLVAAGLAHTPLAALSRSTGVLRGATVIVSLPGSPKAVREGATTLGPFFRHLATIASTGGSPCTAA